VPRDAAHQKNIHSAATRTVHSLVHTQVLRLLCVLLLSILLLSIAGERGSEDHLLLRRSQKLPNYHIRLRLCVTLESSGRAAPAGTLRDAKLVRSFVYCRETLKSKSNKNTTVCGRSWRKKKGSTDLLYLAGRRYRLQFAVMAKR